MKTPYVEIYNREGERGEMMRGGIGGMWRKY